MLEPIMVRCSSKEVKETWLDHLTRILKLNRLPTTISTAPQVQECSSNGGQLDCVGEIGMQLSRFNNLTLQRRVVSCKSFQTLVQQNETFFHRWAVLSKFQGTISAAEIQQFHLQPYLDLFLKSRLPYQMPRSIFCGSHIACSRRLLEVRDNSALSRDTFFPQETSFSGTRALPTVSTSGSNISSDSKVNKDSRLRRKRGLFVRQDAFDMGDEDVFDENQNYVFNVP